MLRTLTPREERVHQVCASVSKTARSTPWKKSVRDFQVTRERIRQIEAKALRKLRHPSRSRKLKAFVDTTRE